MSQIKAPSPFPHTVMSQIKAPSPYSFKETSQTKFLTNAQKSKDHTLKNTKLSIIKVGCPLSNIAGETRAQVENREPAFYTILYVKAIERRIRKKQENSYPEIF